MRREGDKGPSVMSKSVDDSVKWHHFDEAVAEIRTAFADLPVDKLQNIIDEALASASSKKDPQVLLNEKTKKS